MRTMCQLWQFLQKVVFPTSLSRRRTTDCESQVPRHLGEGRRSRKVQHSDVRSQENKGSGIG